MEAYVADGKMERWVDGWKRDKRHIEGHMEGWVVWMEGWI